MMYSVSHFTLLESRAQVFRSRLCVSREEDDDEETREYFLSVCLSLTHTPARARALIWWNHSILNVPLLFLLKTSAMF